jgi:hypothetical protein
MNRSHGKCFPDVLSTAEGEAAIRRISKERWAVYMLASGSRTLERLAASLIVQGAVMQLEPWRFEERSGPQDRVPGRTRNEEAIAAYERRRTRETQPEIRT